MSFISLSRNVPPPLFLKAGNLKRNTQYWDIWKGNWQNNSRIHKGRPFRFKECMNHRKMGKKRFLNAASFIYFALKVEFGRRMQYTKPGAFKNIFCPRCVSVSLIALFWLIIFLVKIHASSSGSLVMCAKTCDAIIIGDFKSWIQKRIFINTC